MPTFLAALAVVVLCVLGMSVTIIVKKGGEFPKYDVGSNEQMRKRGIRCFKDEDAALHSTKSSSCATAQGISSCADCDIKCKTPEL